MPPPMMMEYGGCHSLDALPAPLQQNVNRWTQHHLQQQQQEQQQQQQPPQRPAIEEIEGGVPPRHCAHRMQSHRFGNSGVPPRHQLNGNMNGNMNTTPPFGAGNGGNDGGHSPSSSSSGMNGMSLSSRSQTPFESLGQSMDGEFFVSIDVEAAATGHGHFDLAPCRIAMVDFFGNVLFDQIANVPDLMDPLTEFTGLRADQILEAEPLEKVLHRFHALLAELNLGYRFGVTIVGQSPILDLIWTELRESVHYQRVIDIAQLFKTKNQRWSKATYYSLRQAAWGLMGVSMNDDFHDPSEDARVTMRLYRECCLDGHVLTECKQRLQELKWKKRFPDFKVVTLFQQCSGMYNASRCRCGQETARGVDSVEDIETLRALYTLYRHQPVREMLKFHDGHHRGYPSY